MRHVSAVVTAACVAFIMGAASTASGATAVPLDHQIITVEAKTAQSTTAVLRVWSWNGQRYVAAFPPTIANVGIHGIGRTREGLGRTPTGIFTLTQAFGNLPSDGTKLSYFQAGPDDWWDENPASWDYNHHVRSKYSPGGSSENLFYAGVAYSHAVVINYNIDPVARAAGSGFFLHVSTGFPTAGCVAINARVLREIMRWLTPAQHPVISIAVGSTATALLRLG